MAALRELSEHCKYLDGQLEEMLRDRLVCGVQHDGIQKKLLSEKDLTYDEKALELAQSIEAAEKDTGALRAGVKGTGATGAGEVHFTKKTGSSSVCYRCGGDHLATSCKFKGVECHRCKKKGHIARVCRSSKEASKGQHDRWKQKMQAVLRNRARLR